MLTHSELVNEIKWHEPQTRRRSSGRCDCGGGSGMDSHAQLFHPAEQVTGGRGGFRGRTGCKSGFELTIRHVRVIILSEGMRLSQRHGSLTRTGAIRSCLLEMLRVVFCQEVKERPCLNCSC